VIERYLVLRRSLPTLKGCKVVFPTAKGNPRSTSNVCAMLRSFAKQRGVRGFSTTNYRRAVATQGAVEGADRWKLADSLGHSVTMEKNYYLRGTDARKITEAEAVGNITTSSWDRLRRSKR
jgi:integrase